MITTLLIKSLLLSVLAYILLRIFIPNAKKFGLIDVPNERSAHTEPIARGAGIIFAFTFLLGVFFFYYLHFSHPKYIYTYISLLIIYATGAYDDFYGISSKKKFLFITIAAIIAYYDGFAIHSIGNYFGYELKLGYFALPFTIFAIVGVTNAINLTDGLDGLAASISIVILLGLLYIGIKHNDYLLTALPMLVIGPLLVFLYFNWQPAKVFMGDSGSLFLGFSIILPIIYALKYVNPVSTLFLVAIPVLDTLIVMRRRQQRKKSLFVADKNHLHHILLSFKKDKLFTVKSLIALQVLFTLIFIQVHDKSDMINLVLFSLLFIIFYKLFDPRLHIRSKEEGKEGMNKRRKEN